MLCFSLKTLGGGCDVSPAAKAVVWRSCWSSGPIRTVDSGQGCAMVTMQVKKDGWKRRIEKTKAPRALPIISAISAEQDPFHCLLRSAKLHSSPGI